MGILAAPRTGRERLLDAAHRLFADAGYTEVGVASLLQCAGVQAPTLYHHFGDKEGLYVAWVEKALWELGRAIRALSDESLQGLAVRLWTRLDFDVQQALRDGARLTRPESRERVVTAYFDAVCQPLVGELVRLAAAEKIREEPIGRLAEAFLGGLYALKRQYPNDPGEIAFWWATLFLRAIHRA